MLEQCIMKGWELMSSAAHRQLKEPELCYEFG